jgi:hypothetical protein
MARKNKRASILDLPYLMGGVLTLAFIAILISILLYYFNVQVQANSVFPTEAKTAMAKMSTDYPKTMNFGIVLAFFGMCLVSLILASLTPTHPIFLIFFILEWVLLIWMGATIANTYQMVIENTALSVISNLFPLTTSLFRWFPWVVGIFGALMAIVIYRAKQQVAL